MGHHRDGTEAEPHNVLGLCQATLTVSKQKASFCHFKFIVISVSKIQAALVVFEEEWVCMPVYTCEEIKKWQYICSFWGWHKLREIKISKWNEPKEKECRGIAYHHIQFLQFCLKVKCSFWGRKMKNRTTSTGISRNSFSLFPWGRFNSSKWVLDLVILSFVFGLASYYTVSFAELHCLKSIFLPWHGTSRWGTFQQFCLVGIAAAAFY